MKQSGIKKYGVRASEDDERSSDEKRGIDMEKKMLQAGENRKINAIIINCLLSLSSLLILHSIRSFFFSLFVCLAGFAG